LKVLQESGGNLGASDIANIDASAKAHGGLSS
jgi:hypothetical protein